MSPSNGMNWPAWYVQLCCWSTLIIAVSALVLVAVWLGGQALMTLWEWLKVEMIVSRALFDHVRKEHLKQELREQGSTRDSSTGGSAS